MSSIRFASSAETFIEGVSRQQVRSVTQEKREGVIFMMGNRDIELEWTTRQQRGTSLTEIVNLFQNVPFYMRRFSA